MALVVLVVILFLQTWRASIIPLVAVPVSIVGTFSLLYLFGFSINALSLFGLVLAIGIVVDDAIVVVENVERNIAAGLSAARSDLPRDARSHQPDHRHRARCWWRCSCRSLSSPACRASSTEQFALTIAISTVISAINSLTLSPALAALLLKSHAAPKDALTRWIERIFGWLFRGFNAVFGRGIRAYGGGVTGVLSRKALMLGIYLALLAATTGLFKAVPGGFVPTQDKQYLIGFAQLPDGATLDRTEEVIRRMGEIMLKHPGVENAVVVSRAVDQRLHQQLELRHRLRRAQVVRSAQEPRALAAARSPRSSTSSSPRSRTRSSPSSRRRRCTAWAPPAASSSTSRTGLARLRGARRRDQGVPREGVPDARARRPLLELPGERAAALRRRRPHQGAPARRGRDRCVRHDADLPGQPVRQRLQQVRPHLLGARTGRRAVPGARRGRRAAKGALQRGRDGAALGADGGETELPDRSARCATTASSPPTSTAALRRASPPGQAQDAIERVAAETLPPGIELRMDRDHVPGDPRRQLGGVGLPDRHPARVPGARRALREPGAAARHHPHRADGPARCADRRVAHPRRQQHLHADRLHGAGGTRRRRTRS